MHFLVSIASSFEGNWQYSIDCDFLVKNMSHTFCKYIPAETKAHEDPSPHLTRIVLRMRNGIHNRGYSFSYLTACFTSEVFDNLN